MMTLHKPLSRYGSTEIYHLTKQRAAADRITRSQPSREVRRQIQSKPLRPIQMIIAAVCFSVAGLFGAMIVQNAWLTFNIITLDPQHFCGAC